MRPRNILLGLFVVGALLPQSAVRADMAPPMTPPGSTLLPGGETTNVRMLAETVTLNVDVDPANAQGAIATTEALFTMRNLGPSEERMQARFPLSFPDGGSDGYFKYPEIPSISVMVDGQRVPTQREMQPPYNPQQYGDARADVPWAVFDVAFPPDVDVYVQISYTVRAYGYYPQLTFDYVLETGAGWNGTIGSADLVVRLPYEVSEQNVLLSQSTPAAADASSSLLVGNEVRWRFVDLEPTREDNLQVTILAPALWRSVIKEAESVRLNPKDGEAWGRLGKAYKESARYPKGWFREDAAGRELVDLSQRAYERCLELLPKDPLWHYGYADLLWSEYYWVIRPSGQPDSAGLLPAALSQLQKTLALDPDNTQATDLLNWISGDVPDAVELVDGRYVFLALTATPLPPTPYDLEPSATPASESTIAPALSRIPSKATPEPLAGSPVCGASGLAGLLIPIALMARRKKPD